MSTIHEFDSVELVVDLPDALLEYPDEDAPLHAGDQGAVVLVYNDGAAYCVEFFRDGETVAIADVTPDQIRVVQPATTGVASSIEDPSESAITHDAR